jgi:sensor c-di-GMP phosphodiesterase-like protein
MQVNYNVFPRDFSVESLTELLLERDDIPPGASIAVEVIEVEQLDLETLAREARRLSERGLKTYIDDFGSGYSNLAALGTLPVTGIKLDKSFGLASSDSLQARMLPSVLDLIAATNLQIVVEGVETASRLEELRKTGNVDLVQGYYFSAPLSADDFLAWACENKLDLLKRQIPKMEDSAARDAGRIADKAIRRALSR